MKDIITGKKYELQYIEILLACNISLKKKRELISKINHKIVI